VILAINIRKEKAMRIIILPEKKINKNMYFIYYCIMLIAFIIIGLSACSNSPKEKEEIIYKKIGDEVVLETLNLKINSVEEKQLISSYYGSAAEAAEGAKFVLVVLEVKNTTDTSFAFLSDLKLIDDKGREFDSYPYTIGNIDNYIENRKLSPDIKEIGYLVYEIPADSESYSIHSFKEDTNELYDIKLR
jgi:hypothetical protein